MEFDVLIRNGTVIDGSGEMPRFPADVGINGERIAAVGALGASSAGLEIDAAGQIVSPGFIDVHLHSEVALLSPDNPQRYGALKQGVTTQLLAPDGFGWTPLSEAARAELWQYTSFAHGDASLGPAWPTAESYLRLFEGNTPANVVPQVPHLATRYAVLGWDERPATRNEIDRMKVIVQEWLDAGSVAFNTGLDYHPAACSTTEELIELSKAAAAGGAIYAAHIRYGDLGREAAWRETFEIAGQAGIPVHVSHEHVDDVTEPLLDEAANCCDLTFESYMYPAGCTHLAMMLPTWAQAGGPDAVLARLHEPATRERLTAYLEDRLTGPDRPAGLVIAANQTGRYIGRSLEEVASVRSMPIGECAVQMIVEEHPYALMVFHQRLSDDQVAERIGRTIRHPRMMVASDGIYHGQSGHPRSNGCFARVLRLCVRVMGAITLEQAIHKMSGFPASRFRVPNRGFLREGLAADIVIFDPETVSDRATWDEPRRDPTGISKVLVNGQVVVDEGQPTSALPGRVLRREVGQPA